MLTFNNRNIPETFDEIIDPKHTVLIVHELLNDFCAKGGVFDKLGRRIDASEILEPTVKLIDGARKNNVRVLYVRYTMNADNGTLSDVEVLRHKNTFLRKGGSTPVVDGTWGWENLDEVRPQEGDIIIRKYKVDAFFETPLDAFLRWNGIKTFIIVGIGAEVGIVPTVCHGACLGYFSVGVSDCIRPTTQGRYDDAMKYIGDWALVKTHKEILNAWANIS